MADSINPTAPDLKGDLHRLGGNLETLKSDVVDLAHGAKQAMHSGAAQLQNAGHDALDAAKDKFAQGRHAAEDATESFTKTIIANPLASVGIAAGVGVLIGLILSRPRS